MGVALACVSAADADAARAASKTCFHSRRHHLNSAARARPARTTRMEWIETWVIGWWSPARPAMSGARCSTSRSEEHTSELQSLMRISYAVFCLKKKNKLTKKKRYKIKQHESTQQ